MDISVIVCTYNRAASLGNTLESLRRQRLPVGVAWEVLVVDNNSTDGTREVVRRFAGDPTFPLRYVREERQGISHARNRGIAETEGRYLFFTDDDVLVSPNWMGTLFETFEEGGWDGIGGRILLRCDRPMPRWLKRELWGFLACLDYGERQMPLTDRKRPFFGANMAFRRDVFRRIGTFDPELGRRGRSLVGGEETDLFRRMLEAGMTVVYEPEAVVHHVVDPRRLRKAYFRGLHYALGWTDGVRFGAYSGRQVLGIPGYVFHQALGSVRSYLREGLQKGFHNVFRKEMNIWYFLGFMMGRIRHRIRERGPA